MVARVLMYSTAVCPYCNMAERLLKAKGIDEIEKIRIDLDPEQRALMMEKNRSSYRATDLYWRHPCRRL